MPGKITIHSTLLFVTLIYGFNYTVAKFVMPAYLEPFGFIVFRIASATLLFWLLSSITGTDKIKSRKDFGLLFLCGLFGVATNQLLFFKGLSLTNPINGSVIMTTSPIMVMIVAYALGKESITVKKSIGFFIGAVGAYLLLTKDGVSLSKGTFLGDLLILINGSSYAVYLVLVKPLMAKYKSITVIKWVFLFGGIIAFPFGISELSTVNWTIIPVTIWLYIGFVIIAATFLVYLLNVWTLKFVNSSLVGSYIYLQPVFATLVAVAFRGDQLDVLTILYSLVIMLGVYLVSQK
ncbi:DMT family transporter [Fulvivirga sp. 29W222]|uniref:DMT family transporter n=1 Tax=Fulvivirga marina TaxID=2494733 RepID=A0A937G1Y1_9BACT|nr:DMT family transporter [Fulvivirga marina]MBL6446981.1 DMT family transporter [Fulvivirga marina]